MADYRTLPRKTNSSPIAQLRMDQGLTQGQLAKLCNVPYSTISRWELGTVIPGGKSLVKLAAALGCNISDLLPDNH